MRVPDAGRIITTALSSPPWWWASSEGSTRPSSVTSVSSDSWQVGQGDALADIAGDPLQLGDDGVLNLAVLPHEVEQGLHAFTLGQRAGQCLVLQAPYHSDPSACGEALVDTMLVCNAALLGRGGPRVGHAQRRSDRSSASGHRSPARMAPCSSRSCRP